MAERRFWCQLLVASSLLKGSSVEDLEMLCAEANGTVEEAELRSRMRTEMDNVARHRSLQGYEIPRDFIIEWQPFTKANHLITDSNKMARGQLKKRWLNPSAVKRHDCSSGPSL